MNELYEALLVHLPADANKRMFAEAMTCFDTKVMYTCMKRMMFSC